MMLYHPQTCQGRALRGTQRRSRPGGRPRPGHLLLTSRPTVQPNRSSSKTCGPAAPWTPSAATSPTSHDPYRPPRRRPRRLDCRRRGRWPADLHSVATGLKHDL